MCYGIHYVADLQLQKLFTLHTKCTIRFVLFTVPNFKFNGKM